MTVFGKKIILSMPNGEKREAQFAIVEMDNVLASHNEQTFAPTPGYPVNEQGQNVNDRNYEDDVAAQERVRDNARRLDPYRLLTTSRTPSGSPIVAGQQIDGKWIVVSGNNRTMSTKLAASQHTENYKAYVDALCEELEAFGFSTTGKTERIDCQNGKLVYLPTGDDFSINNDAYYFRQPLLVRIDYGFPAFQTQELAKYNQSTMKGKRAVDKTIERSNSLRENPLCQTRIPAMLDEHERMSDFYADRTAQKQMLEALLQCNIITEQSVPEYYDEGYFTSAGKELVESVLAGVVLEKAALKAAERDGIKQARRVVVYAIPVLVSNSTLPVSANLIPHINDAILYLNEMKASGLPFDQFINQGALFSEKEWHPRAIYLSRLMSQGQRKFKTAIKAFNESVRRNTGAALFSDENVTPEEAFQAYVIDRIPAEEARLIESYANAPKQPKTRYPEWLFVGNMGGSTVYADRRKRKNGDYLSIAHLNPYNGEVTRLIKPTDKDYSTDYELAYRIAEEDGAELKPKKPMQRKYKAGDYETDLEPASQPVEIYRIYRYFLDMFTQKFGALLQSEAWDILGKYLDSEPKGLMIDDVVKKQMIHALAPMVFDGTFTVQQLKAALDETLEDLNPDLPDYGKYNGTGYHIRDYILDYVEMEANGMIATENQMLSSLEEEGESLRKEAHSILMRLHKDYATASFQFYEDTLPKITSPEKVEDARKMLIELKQIDSKEAFKSYFDGKVELPKQERYGDDITPDTRPGDYFVSVHDQGQKPRLVLGPFETHKEAINQVEAVRTYLLETDPKGHFYSYGTARQEKGSGNTGQLNPKLGYSPEDLLLAQRGIPIKTDTFFAYDIKVKVTNHGGKDGTCRMPNAGFRLLNLQAKQDSQPFMQNYYKAVCEAARRYNGIYYEVSGPAEELVNKLLKGVLESGEPSVKIILGSRQELCGKVYEKIRYIGKALPPPFVTPYEQIFMESFGISQADAYEIWMRATDEYERPLDDVSRAELIERGRDQLDALKWERTEEGYRYLKKYSRQIFAIDDEQSKPQNTVSKETTKLLKKADALIKDEKAPTAPKPKYKAGDEVTHMPTGKVGKIEKHVTESYNEAIVEPTYSVRFWDGADYVYQKDIVPGKIKRPLSSYTFNGITISHDPDQDIEPGDFTLSHYSKHSDFDVYKDASKAYDELLQRLKSEGFNIKNTNWSGYNHTDDEFEFQIRVELETPGESNPARVRLMLAKAKKKKKLKLLKLT